MIGDGEAPLPGEEAGALAGRPAPDQGVYGIGVASNLVGSAIQNLRAYERAGLVMPSRSSGGNRLYSPEDIARLLRIQTLLAQGLNLAGVAQVLDLQDDNQRLREQLDDLTGSAEPTRGGDSPDPGRRLP